jgi:hypothetical protein
MTRFGRAIALTLALVAASRVHALPPGSETAGEAFDLCQRAERTTGDQRTELLVRGIELARTAIAADANDARAHFALFCNLGRWVRDGGVSVVRLLEVLRVLRELDAAVALAPDDPDVLTAKGALLVSLPRLLGGDSDAGESWLRRALDVDPHHDVARWFLADLLQRRGADGEAAAIRTTN